MVLMLIFSLLAPFNAQASNSLYHDTVDKLLEKYDESHIETGGFSIEPTLNTPTESFEAEMNGDKLKALFADMSSTYGSLTSDKLYRTVAYQYWITATPESGDSVLAYTAPLNYLAAQEKFTEVVRATNAYKNGHQDMNTRVAIPRSTLERELGHFLDETWFIIQTATIEVYNPKTGQVHDRFDVGLEGLEGLTLGNGTQLSGAALEQKAKDNGFAGYGTQWQTRAKIIYFKQKPGPDFFSTPEGEPEWQEHFLTSAKTYRGEIGEEITFPVTLHNIGETAITDFRAVWGGEGDNPTTGWKGDNAPFIATDDGSDSITIEKGKSMTFDVTVKVPNVGKKLYFKANVDGKTPATEKNLDNNITVITIQPDGLDIGIKLIPNQPYWIMPVDLGYTYPVVTIQGSINMENEMLFQADGFAELKGINKEEFQFIKFRNQEPLENSFGFKVTKPGIYKVKACIPAFDEHGNDILFEVDFDKYYKDIKPSNNCDELAIEVRMGDRKLDPPPEKPPTDTSEDETGTRVGLTG